MAAPRRLLFLIAATGGGHRAAAEAVAGQLAADRPGAFDIRVVDPVPAASPGLLNRLASLYTPVVQRAPWAWAAMYHATNSRAAIRAMRRSALRPLEAALRDLFLREAPAAVVSFHPLLNHLMASAAHSMPRRPALVTVITDLVDVHAGWACSEVDAVVVPSPGGLARCRRAGVRAERCHLLGLPVARPFTRPLPEAGERGALRRRLGLSTERFTVLVCGGADGSGKVAERARAVAAAPVDVGVAVVCGHNTTARKQLAGLRDSAGREVVVRGFVDDMADWMRASDLVVTKAGPGTIVEALCSGLPLLLTWYIPGQERGNMEWLVDIGAGRYVPRTPELVDAVAELSSPSSPGLAAMQAAVTAAARPQATRDIADLVAGMAS